MANLDRPGATLAARPLHFIFLLDGSGSMSVDGKIDALNDAIRGALPDLRELAAMKRQQRLIQLGQELQPRAGDP